MPKLTLQNTTIQGFSDDGNVAGAARAGQAWPGSPGIDGARLFVTGKKILQYDRKYISRYVVGKALFACLEPVYDPGYDHDVSFNSLNV